MENENTNISTPTKKSRLGRWMEERKKQKKHFAELHTKPEEEGRAKAIKMDMLNRLKSAVTSVIPGNPLARDFDIQGQVASAGPGLLWKVFIGVKKSTKEEASVFLFEKKSVERFHKKDREIITECLRRGVQQLTKLRHPKILSVLHPIEETREALAFATEPVFASLANVLGAHDNIGGPSKFLADFQLYEVEIKHGLLQVLEGLGFLHSSAKMMHRNICPSSIILAKTGTWKLAGCEFVQQALDSSDQATFSCVEWRSDMPREAQPSLDFMAPEYEILHVCSPASDMFSFGILMYSLYNKGKPLYECRGEIKTFRKNAEELSSIRGSLLASMPSELIDHVKLLLNIEATVRPDAPQMMKIPFFEDMACIALQYIDTLYQRENMEKSNFFKGLPKVIERLPKRVSQQRILPALFKEGMNANMVPFILPSIFLISEQSTVEEYRALVLPHLIPFFQMKEPVQILLMFLQNMNLLLSKTPTTQIQTYVFPLVYSALESDSPQIQELCLNIIPTFADLIEYTTLKKSLIPRVKKLCLGTSVLNVRVNCLLCIGKLMDQMDKWFVLDEILPFLREIPTREPAVLMSILGIHKVALSEAKLGITKDVMANKVLPFLIPLSIDNNLNLSQFNAYMAVIKEMMGKVEGEHRTKLEQLDQIQQEHKTLEIGGITNENGTGGKKVDGKSTFMDKFLSGVGLGNLSYSHGSGDTSTPKKPTGPSNTTSNVSSDVSVTPKKATLSMEEKLKLAKQQEQERALKNQKPLSPMGQSSTPSSQSATKASTPSSSGPRDLTSSLLESNVRNLSLTPQAKPSGSTGSVMSGGMNSPMGGGSWQTTSPMGSSLNWGSASSTHSSQYMTAQSSLSSSTSSLSSGGKPALDLSPLDSLMKPSSSNTKTSMNQIGHMPGNRPIMQPNQQHQQGMMGAQRPPNMMAMGGMQSNSNMSWSGSGNPGFPTAMSGFSQPMNSPGSGAYQGWGGQVGMMGGPMGQPMMQPGKPNQPVQNTKSLTDADLKDFLG